MFVRPLLLRKQKSKLVMLYGDSQEEFEGVTRIVYRRTTENTMAKRKNTKGQTTIYKTYT
jgi:hypothetical protein